MIVEIGRLAIQFPRRPDLSGRPLGVLIVWQNQAKENSGRFAQTGREFGFYLPIRSDRGAFEAVQLLADGPEYGHNIESWPLKYKVPAMTARDKLLKENPGMRVVRESSSCDRRIDLSGRPIQLSYSVCLAA
jgi:hypothetical protein